MPQANKRLSKVMPLKVKCHDSTSLATQGGSQPSNANTSILFVNPPLVQNVVATEDLKQRVGNTRQMSARSNKRDTMSAQGDSCSQRQRK